MGNSHATRTRFLEHHKCLLFLAGGYSSQLGPFNCGSGARFLACRKVDQTV